MSESNVSNRDLLEFLMGIKEDLGAVKANGDNIAESFQRHVSDVKAASLVTADQIKELQIGAARQRGIMAALTVVGTIVGTGVGYAIDLFRSHH